MRQLRGCAAGVAALGLSIGVASAAGNAGAGLENAVVVADPARHELHVSGVIGPDFETDVRNALQRHPRIRRIVVESPGGLRAQALRIGEFANHRRVSVRVEGRCASACVLLWATAASREMTSDSRIGLHGSSLAESLPIPDTMREQLIRRNDRETEDVLRRAGFPSHVIRLGTVTPPTTMAWFSALELKVEGVPFVLLDGGPTPKHAAATAHPGEISGYSGAPASTPD